MAEGKVKDVLLVGLGAVGAIYALVLQRSGLVRLTVVARSNYAALKGKFAEVRKHGLSIESYKYGSVKGWRPDRLVQTVEEAADRTYEYVFLVTKAVPDRTPNSQILAPLLSPSYAEKYNQPTYVLLQNGLNGELDLYHAIKKLDDGKENPKILSAAVYVGVNQKEPHVVVHDYFDTVVLGAYRFNDFTTTTNSPEETALLEDVVGMLVEGGSEASWVPEVQRTKFLKNLRNVAFSSISTLTRYTLTSFFRPPPGESDPLYAPYVAPATAEAMENYTIPTLRATLEECIVLARALGYPDSDDGIPSSCIDVIMDSTRKNYSQKNSTHKPSMMVDMEYERPMEVEVIFGEVVRMAKARGVDVPRVEMLYALLLVVQNQIFRKLDEKATERKS